jgi:hypothetical protein
LGAAVALAAVLCAIVLLRPQLKEVDGRLLGYALTDAYMAAKTGQSWSGAPPLRRPLSYAWTAAASNRELRIAHALGAWRSDHDRNTLDALRRSVNRGFVVVEVDLALATDRGLHCYHGTDGTDARLPDAQIGRVCRLEDLLREMSTRPFVLMLDLKSDFARSAAVVARVVPRSLRGRVVFQLYGPADVTIFNRLPDGFAGPVVTLYRTMRTVHHLDPELRRIGARVVTVPLDRVDEFSRWGRSADRILLTHPIEDCRTFARIEHAGFSGGYMDADVTCGGR